jgi:hypothetical protein
MGAPIPRWHFITLIQLRARQTSFSVKALHFGAMQQNAF